MLLRENKHNRYELMPGTSRNIVISPSGNVRIDSWIQVKKRDGIYVKDRFIKSSHFGNTVDGDHVKIHDYIYTEMDDKGELIDFSSSVTGYGTIRGENCIEPPSVYRNPHGLLVPVDSLPYSRPLEIISELGGNVRNGTVYNNSFYPEEANVFEDTLNAPYMIYGMIIAALTATSFQVPYQASVIMDSDHGFNLPIISSLQNKYEIPADALKSTTNKVYRFLNQIQKGFVGLCNSNEIHFRAHGVVHPFGCVVEIFDKDFPKHKFRTYVNNSDHCRILRTIDAVDRSYLDSELFGSFIDNNIPSAVSSMFDSKEERDDFAYGLTTKNYISTYD